nr:RnfABCDGE type electron transport complex subunit D [Lysobacter sp. CAU 1642]
MAPPRGVRQVMGWVLLALLPAALIHHLWFGWGIWLQIGLAAGFALLIEATALRLRGLPVQPFLTDLSAPLTGVLFAFCLPPDAPWWIAAFGMLFAIGIAKHAYGGLGGNTFNPAMVGYAAALVCFPAEMARWPVPGTLDLGATVQQVFGLSAPLDAIARPTPLDQARNALGEGLSISELRAGEAFRGGAAHPALPLALAFAAGGALLLWQRLIHWRQPAALLLGLLALAAPAWLLDPDLHLSPMEHLVQGAAVMAAFFIITDPVSGCSTPRGQWLFGIGVALLTLLIREFGQYPDGIVFAVLLMNAAAPWIELHSRPRIHGESK